VCVGVWEVGVGGVEGLVRWGGVGGAGGGWLRSTGGRGVGAVGGGREVWWGGWGIRMPTIAAHIRGIQNK